MTEGFGPVENSGGTGTGPLFGGILAGPLDGFLIVANDRAELKALTADASKLWVREFAVSQRTNLDFWTKALRSELVGHRGYHLNEEQRVRAGKGNEGTEMVCDVTVQGQPHRYLIGVYVLAGSFWRRGGAVRTVEFVAPVATFEKSAVVVRGAYGR